MLDGGSTPTGWCVVDKFAAVVESASMNESELSAYCRERGLYAEQIGEWREACEQANDWDRNQNKRLKDIRKADEKRIKALERDLQRKEKALADRDTYIASESSFYRVLKEADQLPHRGRAQAPGRVAKPEAYRATGPQAQIGFGAGASHF